MSRFPYQLSAMLSRALRDFTHDLRTQPLLSFPLNALQSLTATNHHQRHRRSGNYGARRHFVEEAQQRAAASQQQQAATDKSVGERRAEEYNRSREGGQLTAPIGQWVPSLFQDWPRRSLFDSWLFESFPPLMKSAEDSFPVKLAIDVMEDTDKYTIKAAVPGIDKNDIKLRVEKDRDDNRYLVIEAEKKEEKREEDRNGRFIYMESSYGLASRRVPLPPDADPEAGVEAKIENGELRMEIPKNPNKKRDPQEIPIK